MKLEALTALLASRSSARGFLPEPVSRQLLEPIFAAAQQAPSWCNIQPWHVSILSPTATQKISKALVEEASRAVPAPDIPFPGTYLEPYLARRRACGGALYGAMGIERGDKAGRWDAWLRNYEVFGAPHLAVVSRDKRLGEYATLDVGVWLGFLFAAAHAGSIGMCAMASIAAYPRVLRTHLDIPGGHDILFGIALGAIDSNADANKCKTAREPIAESVTFVGADW